MPRGTVSDQITRLQKQRDALDKRMQALKSRTHGKALDKIVELAQKSGVTAAEIAEAMKSGKPARATRAAKKAAAPRAKVAPKYRNPANANETWTGRGRSPVWARELQEAGKLETALISAAVKPAA